MAISGVKYINPPYLIIEEASSINGLFSNDTKRNVFGVVRGLYFDCSNYVIGSSVYFDKTNAVRFKSGSSFYFIVDQKDIFFTETALS